MLLTGDVIGAQTYVFPTKSFLFQTHSLCHTQKQRCWNLSYKVTKTALVTFWTPSITVRSRLRKHVFRVFNIWDLMAHFIPWCLAVRQAGHLSEGTWRRSEEEEGCCRSTRRRQWGAGCRWGGWWLWGRVVLAFSLQSVDATHPLLHHCTLCVRVKKPWRTLSALKPRCVAVWFLLCKQL